jgi:nicotinic acid mononucleotide adenylyltransferase
MCSTEIRQKIVDGVDWSDMVPKSVYNYIIENNLTDKVKALMQSK